MSDLERFDAPDFLRGLEPSFRNMPLLRSKIIAAFNNANNKNVPTGTEPNDEQLKEVAGWLGTIAPFGFTSGESQPKWRIFTSMSQKVSTISQWNCEFCGDEFPVVVIPVRIKPRSYQSVTKLEKRAFKLALTRWFAEKQRFGAKPICIHITVAMSKTTRISDVDNIAKLLLDGIKGTVFDDDRQIEHLSIVRLRTYDDEDYVHLRIAPSTINSADDLFCSRTHHVWQVGDAIELSDYVEL
jgi:Holliday junction resolvase RusA-like endonuclease